MRAFPDGDPVVTPPLYRAIFTVRPTVVRRNIRRYFD